MSTAQSALAASGAQCGQGQEIFVIVLIAQSADLVNIHEYKAFSLSYERLQRALSTNTYTKLRDQNMST